MCRCDFIPGKLCFDEWLDEAFATLTIFDVDICAVVVIVFLNGELFDRSIKLALVDVVCAVIGSGTPEKNWISMQVV